MNIAVGTIGKRQAGKGPMIAVAAFFALALAAAIAVVAWQMTESDSASTRALPRTSVAGATSDAPPMRLLYIVGDEEQAALVHKAEDEGAWIRFQSGEASPYTYEVFVAADQESLGHLRQVLALDETNTTVVDVR